MQPHCTIIEASNGFFVQVVRVNPKYTEIVRATRKVVPGTPVLLNPQQVEDPEDPMQVQQAVGVSMFKGFPDQFVQETYVFQNWSDLCKFLAENPMGVYPTPEPEIVEEDASDGREEADPGPEDRNPALEHRGIFSDPNRGEGGGDEEGAPGTEDDKADEDVSDPDQGVPDAGREEDHRGSSDRDGAGAPEP